ncbi:hypothetical protein D2N39_13345 [Gemmobacter lutimaris]|uniref:Uncharacterized protein n=1 Tax=Gemmobacter lutimaris TaxID=2306023 RepID=A0A398BNG2_9RHOB|nr:hypothetical protein [Gemmobacter lutimaris]RID91234.1 hypothetical protein D2N39_13345 [Gemmobacter lutimaris]
MQLEEADPKGLIRESYNIEGITDGECRSIFIDWALSLRAGTETPEALTVLLARYGAAGHPMTAILEAARTAPEAPRRRGGRIGRMAG